MRESDIGSLTCSIARTIGLIGDQWSLLILRELFLRTRRFEEFQALTGMSPRLLTARLARLQQAGIIECVQYEARPPRYEYRLTEKGLQLHPVMVAIGHWGNNWTLAPGESKPPLELVHKDCGHVFAPVQTCACCQAVVGPGDVQVKMGPAMGEQRAAMRQKFFDSVSRKAAK